VATLDIEILSRLRAFALELKLSAGDGEVVALAGPSGAGKTTVLRCVAGLRRPDAGRIAVGGQPWFEHGRVDLPPQRRSVGYVPQHHALFPHLTVRRNVAFAGADERTVEALLERLGIAALADELPDRLSGGERQRTALARALARGPGVLLLDEPLAALDAQTRRVVRDELADELRRLSIPTLLVTHDFGDASALGDRVAIIVDGRIRQTGTPGELTDAPADAFVVAFTGGSVLRGTGSGRTVELDGGGVVAVEEPVSGAVDVGVYPWEVEVRGGPGPDEALRGIVSKVTVEAGRVLVRVGDWTGETPSADGLEPGAQAHGIPLRAHVLARRTITP
jgi:ABC-type sulfate/molybdate transport systems ATPase subunit